jgi:hypothetical protein
MKPSPNESGFSFSVIGSVVGGKSGTPGMTFRCK